MPPEPEEMDKLTIISGCLFLAADIFAIASLANPDWINTGESAGEGGRRGTRRQLAAGGRERAPAGLGGLGAGGLGAGVRQEPARGAAGCGAQERLGRVPGAPGPSEALGAAGGTLAPGRAPGGASRPLRGSAKPPGPL